MKYVFGPVPSRRLGFSLGVDLVPFKTCCLDCIYCQLGRTTNKTVERADYVDPKEVIEEIERALSSKARTDYITLSGSGEPTLNASIGSIIAAIKSRTDKPVALLTNGCLLYRRDVRSDILEVDLAVPSLDAGSEEMFKKVNRPHRSLTLRKCVAGLTDFRKIFKNEIYLEVMLVKGISDSPEEIEWIRKIAEKINPHRIQLNTVVRPPAESFVQKLDDYEMQRAAAQFGEKCEIIADFDRKEKSGYMEDIQEQIRALTKRRPVTLDDISSTLGLHRNEIIKYIEELEKTGQIAESGRDGKKFYSATPQ